MKKRLSGRITGLVILTALIIANAFPVIAAQKDEEHYSPWYDSVSEMLSAGEYEEGVVIAGIDMSKAARPGDPGSALETKKHLYTEELFSEAEQQDDGVCIISVRRDDMTTEQILKLLASDDSVVFAEPNYIMNAQSLKDGDTNSAKGSQVMLASGNGTAPDASILQWSSNENTSLHAANKANNVAVRIPGWPDGSNMDHEIIVAVVDQAVDFSNPDLADRAYTFSPELKEKLGCDDHGFNAMRVAKDEQFTFENDAIHGTHVAGIIGASWDGSGVSGVASNVRLISVQIGIGNGYTDLLDALRGYRFIKEAIENGVDIRIINNSWGQKQTSKALDAAVTELGRLGAVSVFAAGNNGEDLNASVFQVAMLADNPYAITVAATTPSGELDVLSNYGKSIVTLGAPGFGILSCMPVQNSVYIPSMASANKFYEDFEDAKVGESESLSVKICQVEYSSSEDGSRPDPDKPISGTEGVVVSGDGEMGFEGKNVLKVPVDLSKLKDGEYSQCALKIDFGDVSALGISAGDILGFAYGGKDDIYHIRTFDASGGSGQDDMSVAYKDTWDIGTYTITEKSDTGNLSFIAEISPNDSPEIYFDTFGIGNELQPYGFSSGTSMACPFVSGAAAVIASRHFEELEGLSAPESAERLASYVRSSVRPFASLDGKTSTGGIIDLTVDTGSADALKKLGPDITDLAVNGSEVVLTGSHFGDVQGDASAVKYTAGNNSDLAASVISWSDDSVVLALGKDFEGVMEVTLTATNGKYDSIIKYISKSSDIYEKDHHFGSGTGEVFEIDEPGLADDPEVLGDFETNGLLIAGNGRLYYMPTMTRVDLSPALRSLYCYDPDTDSWTVCPAYPAWIMRASGAWFDGRLYVKGTTVETDDSGKVPFYGRGDGQETGAVCVYSYTPGDSSWVEFSAENVAVDHTLFAAESNLMLAGVTDAEYWEAEDKNYPGPRIYDSESGAGEPLSSISLNDANPWAGYVGGHVCICEYVYPQGYTIYVLDDNMEAAEENSIAFPGFWFGGMGSGTDYSDKVEERDFSLATDGEMLILTGLVAENGSTDTFILDADEGAFIPFDKRASDVQVYIPCAAVLDGRLYVIGSSNFEPGYRVFRSTLLPGVETADAAVGGSDNSMQWILIILLEAIVLGLLILVRIRKE